MVSFSKEFSSTSMSTKSLKNVSKFSSPTIFRCLSDTLRKLSLGFFIKLEFGAQSVGGVHWRRLKLMQLWWFSTPAQAKLMQLWCFNKGFKGSMAAALQRCTCSAGAAALQRCSCSAAARRSADARHTASAPNEVHAHRILTVRAEAQRTPALRQDVRKYTASCTPLWQRGLIPSRVMP